MKPNKRKPPTIIDRQLLRRCIWFVLYDAGRPMTARQIADDLPRFGFVRTSMTTDKINPHLRAMLNLQVIKVLPSPSRYAHRRYRITEARP